MNQLENSLIVFSINLHDSVAQQKHFLYTIKGKVETRATFEIKNNRGELHV